MAGLQEEDLLDDVTAEDPTTVQPPAGPTGSGDVLRDYFMNQKLSRDRLSNAEDTASSNKFLARMGGAAATLANAAAPRAADHAPFEAMAKDAEDPVNRIERQQKLEQGGDKLLLNYFMNKDRSEALGSYRDRKAKVAEGSLDERNRHNQVTEGIGKAGVGLRREGIDLRTGAQAAQAAGTVNKDPVMKTTNNQIAQIEKGLGRIADIKSGKMPFTTTIKADLEKDIANVVSGGNSSSLGQLNRVEFHPYVADIQKAYDKIRGFQGDINSPKYVEQLGDLLSGLKRDIKAIQAGRATTIQKSGVGTAYSKNRLATQALNDAVGTAQPKTVTSRQYSKSRDQTRVIYSDGSTEVLDGRR